MDLLHPALAVEDAPACTRLLVYGGGSKRSEEPLGVSRWASLS